jgi:hypothetical protein
MIVLAVIAVLFALTWLPNDHGGAPRRRRDSTALAARPESLWVGRLGFLAPKRSTLARKRVGSRCVVGDTLIVAAGGVCQLDIAPRGGNGYEYLMLRLDAGRSARVADGAAGTTETRPESVESGADIRLPIAPAGGTISVACDPRAPCRLVRF